VVNVQSNRAGFAAARTAVIAIALQCKPALLVPIWPIIRQIATLITRMILRHSSYEIIPAIKRTKTSFICFSQLAAARYLKLLMAEFASVDNRCFAILENGFAFFGFAYICSPFEASWPFTALETNPLTGTRTSNKFSLLRREYIKRCATDWASFCFPTLLPWGAFCITHNANYNIGVA